MTQIVETAPADDVAPAGAVVPAAPAADVAPATAAPAGAVVPAAPAAEAPAPAADVAPASAAEAGAVVLAAPAAEAPASAAEAGAVVLAAPAAEAPASAAEEIHEVVRQHYAQAAITVLNGSSCCGVDAEAGPALYSALERDELPDAALMASLGCGNPIAVADLHAGERVLDLGSGGGIDVLLSAKRVGPTGRAFGLDMTDEMLTLAMRNAAEAGATNVEFLRGTIESIPLPASSIDVVISNCVVNLAADKTAVFREVARVLRPGGRIGITDILAEDRLTPAERAERGSYAGCVAGALSFSEFTAGLQEAGMTEVSIQSTQHDGSGIHSAIIRAVKPPAVTGDAVASDPGATSSPSAGAAARSLPVVDRGCC